jgi:hypothetical protein
MTIDSADIVPFGKYKGQPKEVLLRDKPYCRWLKLQPWFEDKFPGYLDDSEVYGGIEPNDSPEHNEMQARFLDDDWCLRLATVLTPDMEGGYGVAAAREKFERLKRSARYQEFEACLSRTDTPASIEGRSFEAAGWDVIFRAIPAEIAIRLASLKTAPSCACPCDHAADCPENSPFRGGEAGYSFRCKHRHELDRKRGLKPSDHCTGTCPWSSDGELRKPLPSLSSDRQDNVDAYTPDWCSKAGWLEYLDRHGSYYRLGRFPSFLIELKPDLGDDYPAVLRQVKSYRTDGSRARCVVARRYAFRSVTWEQVKKIFAAEDITLIAEREIAAVGEPVPTPSVEDEDDQMAADDDVSECPACGRWGGLTPGDVCSFCGECPVCGERDEFDRSINRDQSEEGVCESCRGLTLHCTVCSACLDCGWQEG